MNLKRELVKTGNYFFQPGLHHREKDLDVFKGKPFAVSSHLLSVSLVFASSQRMTVRAKPSKQNKKNNYENVIHFTDVSIPIRTLMSFPGTYFEIAWRREKKLQTHSMNW
jgi:hypothetical protein